MLAAAFFVAAAPSARATPDALPEIAARAAAEGGAAKCWSLIRAGGPFRYDRDGVVFGNRERLPARASAGLLSRVHGADAGRAQPRRAAHRLRGTADGARRLLLHGRSLPVLCEDPRMKAPDLAIVDDAGVHPWTGTVEPLKTAAAHAHLKFATRRSGACQGSRDAVRGTRPRAQAARAFRPQLGRARRRARGPRLARQDRPRDRCSTAAPPIAATIPPTGRRSRTSWPKPPSSGRSGTWGSGCSRPDPAF